MDWKIYDYQLPEENLALKPAQSRDKSKLFIYNSVNDEILFDYFLNLDKYLPKKSFLVLNNTKVAPVRVEMIKKTGGKVKTVFLINEYQGDKKIKLLVDRKVNVGDELFFQSGLSVKIIEQKEKIFLGSFDFEDKKLFEQFYKYGSMPIPIYLKKTSLSETQLKKSYQTVFAKKVGSVAAPTASLHFTNRVFKKIKKKGINKFFITLHVGMGTFTPVTEENLKNKSLHEEYYEVDYQSFKSFETLRKQGKKLVAVGTTVVRTLESVVRSSFKLFRDSTIESFIVREFPLPMVGHSKAKKIKPSFLLNNNNLSLTKNQSFSFFEKTNLFIFPPFNFKMVDCLITNFHLPKSSLMMLVEAFLQHKKAKRHLVDLYKIAIENNFRFYSFGDAMLIV